MIQAAIIIELTSGAKIKYVRDALYAKTGDDGATNPTQKYAGVPCEYYAYTGNGNDTYDDQTGNAGMLLDDFSAIETSFAAASPKYLSFPESAGATDELVRYNKEQSDGKRTYIRTKILKDKISRIYIEEIWTSGINKTDSKKMLPAWDSGFRTDGWNEDKPGKFVFPKDTAVTLSMPKYLTKTATANSITVTWQLDSNYSGYNIYLGDKVVSYNNTTGTYTFTGLTSGTQYCVGVNGFTTSGKKGAINYVFVKTS